MSMMWVKKQSKWAIIVAALLIGGSLIMMDLPSSQGMSSAQSVGTVDGEEISTAAFQQDLQNAMRGEESRTGRAVTGADAARLRRELFNYKVQQIVLDGMTRDYALRATPEEMRDWLRVNPRDVAYSIMQMEGPEAVPPFLTDSLIDPNRYAYWLAQDSVYDRPGLRMLEVRLRDQVIPQTQIQQIFRSQVHRTDLEEAFLLSTREDKASMRYYFAAADAFPEAGANPDEEALKAHFEALPDSFWYPREAVRLAYVRFPLLPSAADSALMRDFAGELRERAVEGESFEELARSYSADPGSASEGGRLPPAARDEWVPAFSQAAFALAPGEISEPVLTAFGWHIILKHETVREGGTVKAVVSHILLNIVPGNETVDAVATRAEEFRDAAAKDGLKEAAEAAGLTVSESPVFEKGTLAPLGPYVPGVASFSFGAAERKAKVSEVLQNEEGAYVLTRAERYDAGRDFERAREAVAASYARSQRLQAAREAVETARAQAVAAPNDPPAQVGEATLQVTGLIESEGFATGFGFGGSALYRVLHQEPGEWGPVLETAEGAVAAQVTGKLPVDEEEKARRILAARSESDLYQTSNLYQQWGATLARGADVVDNLDEVYRN